MTFDIIIDFPSFVTGFAIGGTFCIVTLILGLRWLLTKQTSGQARHRIDTR